jgi:hypothetical protein
MSDEIPNKITVFVYWDAMDFTPSKKVLRRIDQTPPDDIDCELSSWTRTTLVEELIEAVQEAQNLCDYTRPEGRFAFLDRAIAAIQDNK